MAELNRRLASDEFAGSVSNLSAVHQIKLRNNLMNIAEAREPMLKKLQT